MVVVVLVVVVVVVVVVAVAVVVVVAAAAAAAAATNLAGGLLKFKLRRSDAAVTSQLSRSDARSLAATPSQ